MPAPDDSVYVDPSAAVTPASAGGASKRQIALYTDAGSKKHQGMVPAPLNTDGEPEAVAAANPLPVRTAQIWRYSMEVEPTENPGTSYAQHDVIGSGATNAGIPDLSWLRVHHFETTIPTHAGGLFPGDIEVLVFAGHPDPNLSDIPVDNEAWDVSWDVTTPAEFPCVGRFTLTPDTTKAGRCSADPDLLVRSDDPLVFWLIYRGSGAWVGKALGTGTVDAWIETVGPFQEPA